MSLIQVYHGIAGSLKSTYKIPFLAYENKETAKEFANNYTDLNKAPKVVQFELNTVKVLDLTTESGMTIFKNIVEKDEIDLNDILDHRKEKFEYKKAEYDNLDKLAYKKLNKVVLESFDVIKGYTYLGEKKVVSYAVINTDVIVKKDVFEIETEGNLWKIEFKKQES